MRWWSSVVVLSACGSKDAGPPPAPPDKTPTLETRPQAQLGVDRLPQPVVDLPRQLSFRLLEPGADERAILRYAVGDTEVTTWIEMSLASRQTTGATQSPFTTLPPIRTGLVVASSGTAKLRARPLPGEVRGAATPEALSYLAGWRTSENRRLTLGFDDRGVLGPIAFGDDPTGVRSREAIDDLSQRLLAVVVPVPEEPVGIGARWRVVTSLVQRPVVVKQTATYTLLERGVTGWKIGVDLQRIGEEQTIIDPSIGSDAMVELVALVRRYTGTLEITPTRALPTGTLEIESSMHLRVQPRSGPMVEQILEDKGTVELALPH